MNRFLFFIVSIVFLTSCVSKKKHLLALDTQAQKDAALLEQEVSLRDSKLNRANATIEQLNLDLAEAKGENNILLMLRGELQDKIVSLESSIENLSNRSSSTQQNLNQTVQQKEAEIARLKGVIREVNATLDRHTQLMGTLAGDLRQEISAILQDQYFIETGVGEVRLILLDELIFRKKSVIKVSDLSRSVFEKFSQVLQRYPTMQVSVISHTDTSPLRRKSDVDKWNYSAQQAATVVRLLTEDFDIGPSRVLLGAKGEFSPRTSNATDAGKRENNRVEIILAPRTEEMVRAVRKVLE